MKIKYLLSVVIFAVAFSMYASDFEEQSVEDNLCAVLDIESNELVTDVELDQVIGDDITVIRINSQGVVTSSIIPSQSTGVLIVETGQSSKYYPG